MMNWDLSQFHFIRPWWLALLPVLVGLWYFAKFKLDAAGWENYLPQPTIRALRINNNLKSHRWHWWLLASLLVLALAAAGPSWTKQAVPVVKNIDALVLMLDLSPSMLAEDLKPDRLTRAKLKLIDILRRQRDGLVALIVYAGDAHTVSPLTDDPATIEALLPALHPSIMPSRGSNTEASVDLAQQLLQDAGVPSGRLLLLTDGIAAEAAKAIRARLQAKNSLSILAVGGAEAVPVPDPAGGFLKKKDGEILLAGVNPSALSELATSSRGRFSILRADDADVDYLLADRFASTAAAALEGAHSSYDIWEDMGHWLVLLVLPFAAFCFRKGFIYLVPLTMLLPFDAEAAPLSGLSWQDLWKTPDQQAAELMQENQYAAAAEKFKRQDWQAIANFRSGEYAKAAQQFGATDDGDSTHLYNRANALAFDGKLEAAIEAYQQVLEQQPEHADAAHNRKVVEQLLQQQQEQQNQENQQNQQKQQGDKDQSGEAEQSATSPAGEGEQQTGQQDSPNPDQDATADDSNSQQNTASQQAPHESSQQSMDEPDVYGQDATQADTAQAETPKDSSAQRDQPESPDSVAPDGLAQEDPGQAGEDRASVNAADPNPLTDSSEQWLRSIEDDPSGLLRRKFEYQTRQRAQQQIDSNQPATNPTDDRY